MLKVLWKSSFKSVPKICFVKKKKTFHILTSLLIFNWWHLCCCCAGVCVRYWDCVCGCSSKFNVHYKLKLSTILESVELVIWPYLHINLTVVICISSTNVRRILASLSSRSQVIWTHASRAGGEPRECLEIQPQLANIIRDFAEGEGTRPARGRGVGAGVVWISDVGGVGGDGAAAGRGGDHTWTPINSKA